MSHQSFQERKFFEHDKSSFIINMSETTIIDQIKEALDQFNRVCILKIIHN
jgi:hypothetical protein